MIWLPFNTTTKLDPQDGGAGKYMLLVRTALHRVPHVAYMEEEDNFEDHWRYTLLADIGRTTAFCYTLEELKDAARALSRNYEPQDHRREEYSLVSRIRI